MQEKIKKIVEDKITANDTSLKAMAEDVERRMFPAVKTILINTLEDITGTVNNLYLNHIKLDLIKLVESEEIKIGAKILIADDLTSGLAFPYIKQNKKLTRTALKSFATIPVGDGRKRHMKYVLKRFKDPILVGNRLSSAEITKNLQPLKGLGFDIRPSIGGEGRGVGLARDWNKYRSDHPNSNFWQFLMSEPIGLSVEQIKAHDAVIGGAIMFLTSIAGVHPEVRDYFDLTTLVLEKTCEQAQQLHHSKIQPQPNVQPIKLGFEDYADDLDKLFSATLEPIDSFQLKDHVNAGLLAGVGFQKLSEQYTTYEAIAKSEAYEARGASSKIPMFIMGDTHAAYGYHLFTFLMKGLKKDANINDIASQEELNALGTIMAEECSLEINREEDMKYNEESQQTVAAIFNKLSEMCKNSQGEFKELFDIEALQGYLLLGDNIFDRKMSPLLFEPFLDFMIALRENNIIPEQILGNHDIIPINSTAFVHKANGLVITDRQFVSLTIGTKIATDQGFKDRILQKHKRYIELNTFVKYLPKSDTYISHAAILESRVQDANVKKFQKFKTKPGYGLYLGQEFKLGEPEAIKELNQTLRGNILNAWGDANKLKQIAIDFTNQRVHGDGHKDPHPLNQSINQIYGHDGNKYVSLLEDNEGFAINLNLQDMEENMEENETVRNPKSENAYNTCAIWLY
jgi:hypothetical protein